MNPFKTSDNNKKEKKKFNLKIHTTSPTLNGMKTVFAFNFVSYTAKLKSTKFL